MELSTFETLVIGLTDEVWLISESEHPFSYTQFSASNSGGLPALLAQKHQADVQKIKTIAPEDFLSKIEKASAGSDAIIVANTQRSGSSWSSCSNIWGI
ncbi:nuclease A inhibitor family protein [Niabella hibiscisoli]|nr:nuclease A inhibitor family protein [Niabella hibiscisoli]MCH5720008.1 nuclease A inhibitor family protein [Niabella hibiscisoli]